MNYDILPSKEINADIIMARYSISSLGNPSNDEALYNIGAYHAQQAIEKCLKFYLRDVYGEDENNRRFRIHDIDTLCSRLKDRYNHSVNPEIIQMANDITDWEANSRYHHSLVTAKNEIEKVLDIAETMLKDIRVIEYKLNNNIPLTQEDIAGYNINNTTLSSQENTADYNENSNEKTAQHKPHGIHH